MCQVSKLHIYNIQFGHKTNLLSDDLDVLKDAGRISHEIAEEKALSEFEKYRVIQDKKFESDFEII